MKHSGSDWLKDSLRIGEMSPLGEAVGDLLGELYQGIYHIESRALERVDWSNDLWISIVLPPAFATFDGCRLTHLVLLCHDRMIRCEIKGKSSWGHMEFMFHQRKGRDGQMHERHPTIEKAIEGLRNYSGGHMN